MRFYSGFVGYFVLWIFGTSPYDVALNIQEFWWTLFFWLPGLIATQRPESKRKYNPWFFAGCFFYILAFTIWLQGNMMINPDSEWCYPDSIIQPHALWHIICALATLSFFFFYRTEKRLQTSQNIWKKLFLYFFYFSFRFSLHLRRTKLLLLLKKCLIFRLAMPSWLVRIVRKQSLCQTHIHNCRCRRRG